MVPPHAHAAKPTTQSARTASTRNQTKLSSAKGSSSHSLPSIHQSPPSKPNSYVQILESQHTQLIAGLQELYRRIQSGESFPTSSALEPAHYGQPLTHKILEALGVLQGDEWDDNNGEDFENDPSW
ncbi:hypothetical protein OEA41_010563 [Lepraria neglecta]|uniref:Uncharacterized protein n=1 Tax=Lepraria neglecta TaxID=209136 RepID=A0AAD9YY30_9LECA|nr:hypothetical protein OEA41_010563 [Lepraria neglecta]